MSWHRHRRYAFVVPRLPKHQSAHADTPFIWCKGTNKSEYKETNGRKIKKIIRIALGKDYADLTN